MVIVLIDFFDKVSATLSRATGGTYTNGVWVPSSRTTTSVTVVSPQPYNGEELQMLEKGENKVERLRTWIKSDLRLWEHTGTTVTASPDYLVINSKTYEIHKVNNRSVDGVYYEAIITEVIPNE